MLTTFRNFVYRKVTICPSKGNNSLIPLHDPLRAYQIEKVLTVLFVKSEGGKWSCTSKLFLA